MLPPPEFAQCFCKDCKPPKKRGPDRQQRNITAHLCRRARYLMETDKMHLTPREQQIADRVSLGWKYPEIAEDLSLRYTTLKTYACRLYRKLGVNSQLQLALMMRGAAVPISLPKPPKKPRVQPVPALDRLDELALRKWNPAWGSKKREPIK